MVVCSQFLNTACLQTLRTQITRWMIHTRYLACWTICSWTIFLSQLQSHFLSSCTLWSLHQLRNDLYCVGWGVKLYSLTHSLLVGATFNTVISQARVAELLKYDGLVNDQLFIANCLLSVPGKELWQFAIINKVMTNLDRFTFRLTVYIIFYLFTMRFVSLW